MEGGKDERWTRDLEAPIKREETLVFGYMLTAVRGTRE